MTAILDDVRARLIAAGLVEGATGWVCRLALMPEDPDQVVALFDGVGLPPDVVNTIDMAGMQVRVRAAADDYAVARAKIDAIMTTLNGQESAIGAGYVYVNAAASVLPLGRDIRSRPELVINFNIMRTA